jgi:hypothetical protein
MIRCYLSKFMFMYPKNFTHQLVARCLEPNMSPCWCSTGLGIRPLFQTFLSTSSCWRRDWQESRLSCWEEHRMKSMVDTIAVIWQEVLVIVELFSHWLMDMLGSLPTVHSMVLRFLKRVISNMVSKTNLAVSLRWKRPMARDSTLNSRPMLDGGPPTMLEA